MVAMKIGENIQRIRQQKQMTLPALANEAGLSKGYIYMLESGEMTNPSVDVLDKIANALSCTIADLLGHRKTAIKASAVEIPDSLTKFAKQRRRAGEPLSEDDIVSLAATQFRGRRPETVEDWAYLYEFFKRTFEKKGG
jgi:transcriptional regulator with XRE-family HTH domain